MTLCIEYLSDTIFYNSLKYYVFVRYTLKSDKTNFIGTQCSTFVEKQYVCSFLTHLCI